LTNPSFSGICKAIRVCIRGESDSGTRYVTVSIYDGATQIGGNKTIALTTTRGNRYSTWWTGLSKTSANLSDLRVQIVSEAQIMFARALTVDLSVTAL
jgi:hypothetical protein